MAMLRFSPRRERTAEKTALAPSPGKTIEKDLGILESSPEYGKPHFDPVPFAAVRVGPL